VSTIRPTLPLLGALALLFVAGTSTAGGVPEWAAAEIELSQVTTQVEGVRRAIDKTLPKAPAWKPGPAAHLMIMSTDGGSRAEVISTTLIDDKQLPELTTWMSKWILPVGEPGMAVPVRVWWEKPARGEKKEKLKKGQEPTQPPPGLRIWVGYEVKVEGAVAADEVLRAVRLVFSAEQACPDDVAGMRIGTLSTTMWHLDVAGDGSILPVPQDVYVPPPILSAKEQKALEDAQAIGGEAAGAAGIEGPEAPAPPEAPKFELPGGIKAPEKAEKEEEPEEEVVPPREWTTMELCVAERLKTARIKPPADGKKTLVDDLPVVVRKP
jgi:hypothetical protein